MYQRANLMLAAALRQEILAFVAGKCAECDGAGFRAEFIPRCLAAPLTYVKQETEQKTSLTLTPSSAHDGVLEALQTAVDQLPQGISAKLATKRTVDRAWNGAETHQVQYYLDLTVSPSYAAAKKEESL